MHSQLHDDLVEFALTKNIYIHPSVRFQSIRDGERIVVANKDIANNEVIMRVPSTIIVGSDDRLELHPFQTFLRDLDLSMQEKLAIILHSDARTAQFIKDFVRSIEVESDLLIYWSDNELSMLQDMSLVENTKRKRVEFDHEFQKVSNIMSKEDYAFFRFLISTRSFLSDNLNEEQQDSDSLFSLAYIPLVDMLNHSDDPNSSNQFDIVRNRGKITNVSYVVRATKFISAGSEITISYGDMTSKESLESYGFISESMKTDGMSIDVEYLIDIVQAVCESSDLINHRKLILDELQNCGFSEIFVPRRGRLEVETLAVIQTLCAIAMNLVKIESIAQFLSNCIENQQKMRDHSCYDENVVKVLRNVLVFIVNEKLMIDLRTVITPSTSVSDIFEAIKLVAASEYTMKLTYQDGTRREHLAYLYRISVLETLMNLCKLL
jgi:SET domain